MTGIICAIRGGPFSRLTIKEAIALSKESEQTLYFLYVVNLDFLNNALHANVHVMTEEMHQLGEFILLNAQETARKSGVQAEAVIRKGQVGDEIIALCREKDADFVILGKPKTDQENNVIDLSALDAFAQRIEEASNAKVIFVETAE
jgi:nucleotide-binding universal stress UspA family protein